MENTTEIAYFIASLCAYSSICYNHIIINAIVIVYTANQTKVSVNAFLWSFSISKYIYREYTLHIL